MIYKRSVRGKSKSKSKSKRNKRDRGEVYLLQQQILNLRSNV